MYSVLDFSFLQRSRSFSAFRFRFFAVVFLVVYVGAVAVLSWCVMMLDITISEVNEMRYLPIGALSGAFSHGSFSHVRK